MKKNIPNADGSENKVPGPGEPPKQEAPPDLMPCLQHGAVPAMTVRVFNRTLMRACVVCYCDALRKMGVKDYL